MEVAIVYDSMLGTTRRAAESMREAFLDAGHRCVMRSVAEADPARVAEADVICVGSWTQGLFVVGQRPTTATVAFLRRLGSLRGKRALVFCTYRLAPGSTLEIMARHLTDRGADVRCRFPLRGAALGSDFRERIAALDG